MIDVARAQHLPRELLQIEVLFVGGMVGADDAEFALSLPNLLELGGYSLQRARPGHFFEMTVYPHERCAQPVRMLVEIEGIASLDAQELAVDAGMIAVIAADDLVIAHT